MPQFACYFDTIYNQPNSNSKRCDAKHKIQHIGICQMMIDAPRPHAQRKHDGCCNKK